jgi:diguanylate cyclase (GGDEF)-like protein
VAAQAAALRLYANQRGRTGGLEAAVRACEDSATLLRKIGDESGLCETLLVKAYFYLELGLAEEALENLDSCRTIARGQDDQTQLYWIHNRLGMAHSYIGELERADDYLLRAVHQAEHLDDVALFSAVNNFVANTAEYVPKLRAAGHDTLASAKLALGRRNADRALELARKVGNPHRESIALANRAMLSGLNGDYNGALEDLAGGRALAVMHGYRSVERATIQYEGAVLLWRGDSSASADMLERAVELAIADDELPAQLVILELLSQAYEDQGQFEMALRAHKRFRAMELQVKSSRADIRARLLSGQLDVDKAKLETDVANLRTRTYQLEQAAFSDALTGIGNRRYLDDVLPKFVSDAKSAGRNLCIAVLDIDHFKGVNDTFGHGVGDDVLARAAQLILGHSRATDVLGRLGGEEFLIAFLDADLSAATIVAERIRSGIQDEKWNLTRPGLAVTISIGIAALTPGDDLAALIARADEWMYRAKTAGRNRVESGAVQQTLAQIDFAS